MSDNFFCEVNVDFRPIKMTRGLFLNIQDIFERLVFKPGEFIIRHEKFIIMSQDPDSVTGNMSNFNC